MRLKSVTVAAMIFVLIFPTALFAANPKAGAKCTKLGSSQLSAGKKFTCIKSGRKLVWNKGIVIATTKPTQNGTTTVITPPDEVLPTPVVPSADSANANVQYEQSAQITNSEECKIQDARIIRTQPNNSGFPITPDLIPATGISNYVFIPIDFSDAVGTDTDLDVFENQIKSFQNWFQFSSQEKHVVKVQFKRKWFRAPKVSSEYVAGKNLPNSNNTFAQIWDYYAQEFLDAASSEFDFTNVHAIIFHLPRNQKSGISHEILGRGVRLSTPQGVRNLLYWGSGNYHYQLQEKQGNSTPDYWAALWVHEVLHSMGLSLHAPGNGFYSGVGQNQGGLSWVLDAWEAFKLGWFNENQIFCAPIEKISKSTVLMQPIESNGTNYKTVIVPLNKTKALIIESRRGIGYSQGWPKGTGGILVYELDTTLDNDRSKECCGDSGNDRTYTKWSYYMPSDQRGLINSQNVTTAVYDYLFKPNETLTVNGLKITYLKMGDTDVVQLARI